jgi:hypothetical protein
MHIETAYLYARERPSISMTNLSPKAQGYTGIQEKTKLIHLGLEALIQREAALRLAALAGTAPGAKAGRRRRNVSAGRRKINSSQEFL